MAVTEKLHTTTSNAATTYSFTFPYFLTTDIKVSIDDAALTTNSSDTTYYSLPTATEVKLHGTLTAGKSLRIYRKTDVDTPKAVFSTGSTIRASDLNNNFDQVLYSAQEESNNTWLKGDATLNSGETWVDDNNHIVTAAAIDDRLEARRDAGLYDTRYYTETELNAGQLDNRYYTETELGAGQLDSRYYTETELNAGQLDNRYFTETESDARYFRQDSSETISSGDTWSAANTHVATTAAIDARIIDLVDDVGGFWPIENETSFPNANPDVNNGAGTIVSIKALTSSITTGGSDTTHTIANGRGTGNAVIISGLTASTTYAAGFGMLVETTTTAHTYKFHRLTPKATEVTTVAGSIGNINTVGSAIANVNTVAANSTNVTKVANIDANVTKVADIDSNVTTVAGVQANVTTVAGIASDVTTVAGEATEIGRLGTADAVSDMNTLGTTDNVSDMNTLASISAKITTVADNNANVTKVADVDTDVTKVADIDSDVTTVADNDTNVTKVANIDSNVTTVANNNTNITTVAGKATELGRLGTADAVSDMNTLGTATNVTNMDTVAGISGNVTTVAGISANVTTVANDGTDIGLVAGSIANVNTTAGSIANVNTTAGGITNINTTAGSIANVNTTAGSIANVNTTAGSIANVNTVATNITNVNNASTYLNNFLALYLGEATSNPSSDTFGNALSNGDLYFNSAASQVRFWNGSAWQTIWENAIDTNSIANKDFSAVYTASAGSNSIDLGGLAISGATFPDENNPANKMALALGSVNYSLGSV